METWKRTLLIICIAEFTVMIGFGFVMPFVPLFIERLGHYTPQQASLWAGIATGGSGLAMFLTAPIWGVVADRFGRKSMLLRAQFGAGVVVGLMGISTAVFHVVGLRIIQGVLTGTVPAASALIAAQAPRDKLPFCMAMLMLSIQTGNMMGPAFGGVAAGRFGYATTFFIASALLTAGGIAVLFFIKEKFTPPARGKATTLRDMLNLAFSKQMLPLLLVMCIINIPPQMIGPTISLLINTISQGGEAATASGITFAIMSGSAALAGFTASRLAKRLPLTRIILFCCIGAAIFYLPPVFAQTVPQMIIAIGITGLMTGGLGVTSNTLIGYSVPVTQQGIAFGLGQSANALGGGLGPFIGGAIGSTLGLRLVFPVGAALFIIVAVVVVKVLSKRQIGRPVETMVRPRKS